MYTPLIVMAFKLRKMRLVGYVVQIETCTKHLQGNSEGRDRLGDLGEDIRLIKEKHVKQIELAWDGVCWQSLLSIMLNCRLA